MTTTFESTLVVLAVLAFDTSVVQHHDDSESGATVIVHAIDVDVAVAVAVDDVLVPGRSLVCDGS